MIIDCGQCTIRGAACATCAVTFVTEAASGTSAGVRMAGSAAATAPGAGPPPGSRGKSAPVPPGRRQDAGSAGKPHVIELDADEIRALAVLANAGMIPRLRYAPPMAKAS